MNRTLPTPEQKNFGRERYAQGYDRGYETCLWDARKRKLLKDRSLFLRFSSFIDHLDDILHENRKR